MELVTTIASAMFDPIFFIMVYVTYLFYKKNVQLEKSMLTFAQTTAKKKVTHATLEGIITGLLGSWLMKAAGIPLEITSASLLLIPAALLLSLKNPRFACFSYAAPIVGVVSLFIPTVRFDIVGIVSLVGSLHLMESLLIYLVGAKESIPVMVRLQGDYVGGYTMQKYWPIPIALLTTAEGLVPLCGILGFGSIAVTTTPEKKAKKMGLLIGLYALVILAGARIAHRYPSYKLLALIIMPLLHEIIYYLDRHFETNKPPIYTAPPKGIRVLDVKHYSYGHEMGIQRGDIIHQINNYNIENAPDYYKILKQGHHKIRLRVSRLNGNKEVLECQAKGLVITELGIVPLPTYSVVVQTI